MRIGLLSLPDNFHCRKWANALIAAGASVTVFTLGNPVAAPFPVVQIPTRIRKGEHYLYPAFFSTAKALKRALIAHQIDIVYAQNVSPFGTWAWLSGFRPFTLAAMGADILEHLLSVQSTLDGRYWNSIDTNRGLFNKTFHSLKNKFYRWTIQQSLADAAFITADNQVLIDALHTEFSVPPSKLHLLRWGLDERIYSPFYASKITVQANAQWMQLCQELGCSAGKKIVLSPRGLKRIYHSDTCLAAIAQMLQDPKIGVHGTEKSIHWNSLQWLVLTAGYDACQEDLKTAYDLASQFPAHFHVVERLLSTTEMAVIWQQTDYLLSFPVYDGLSSAVLEGSYMGALPIVSPIPAHEELITAGWQGIVSASLDAKDLFQTMQFALQMPEEQRKRITRDNQAWVKKYALLEDSAYSYIKLSENILSVSGK
jgi:glycosyltransferase involved in cell wall biosynthesis